jgi:hypothetical protein
MNRFACAAATAALTLVAGPAMAQQQGYTPPPGYVLVPAPPPGQTLQPVAPPPQQAPPGYTLQPVVRERSYAIGASAGVGFPGSISVGNSDYDTKTGFRFGAYADFFLANKISMGLLVDRVSFDIKDSDVGVAFTALQGTVVGHFGQQNEGHFRAGLGIGLELGTSDAATDDSTGLGLRIFAGYVVPMGDGSSFFIQGSVQGSPSGGTKDVDVTYGPLYSISAGLEFGK